MSDEMYLKKVQLFLQLKANLKKKESTPKVSARNKELFKELNKELSRLTQDKTVTTPNADEDAETRSTVHSQDVK